LSSLPYFDLDNNYQVIKTAYLPLVFKKKLRLSKGLEPINLFLKEIIKFENNSQKNSTFHFEEFKFMFTLSKHNGYYRVLIDLSQNTKNTTPLNRYKLLVEAANDVIFEVDLKGYFIYVNPKVLDFGYPENEIIGAHFTLLIREDWVDKTMAFYLTQISDSIRSTYFEFPIITANGHEIWVGQRTQLLEDETGILGLMAVCRDITAEKNKKLAIQRSEEKYRGIIQNLNVGLLEVDVDHNIQFANKAFANLVGYTKDELLSMNARDSLVTDEAREIIIAEQEKRNDGISSYYEVPLLHKNGCSVWTLISGATLFDDKGNTIGSIGIHLDISERKANVAELAFGQQRLDKYKHGLELINEITSNTSLTAKEHISLGLETAASYLELPIGIISEIEEDNYNVWAFYTKENDGSLNEGQVFDLKNTYCEIVFKKESFLAIEHFSKSDHSNHPCFALFGLESYIGAPYYVNGELRGTINFTSPSPKQGRFDSFDTEFISFLAKWVGTLISQIEAKDARALEQSFLTLRNEELVEQKEFLSTINSFVPNLLNLDDLEGISWEIAENVIQAFGYEDCVIYLLNKEGTGLYQLAAYGAKNGENSQIVNPIEIQMGQGIVGTVAQSGIAELIHDTSKDPRYIVDDVERLSELCVPIITDGEVIGVIDSESSKKNFYSEKDLESLTTVANLAAHRLKMAKAKALQSSAEEALLENELKLRTIINSALDAVISIDGEGLVTEWNMRAEKMFGYKAEEVLGTPLTSTIIPHTHRSAHKKGMGHYHKTGEGPVLGQKIEITALKKSGEEFPIELAIVPIIMKGVHSFTAFISDITIQKQVQKETEKALLKERELNELKSRFVAMTSHEFRTPLTTIKQNIDIVSHKISKDLPDTGEAYNKYLGRIESEINRVTLLMNDILALGRIESGGIELNKKSVDLVAIFQEAIRINTQSRSDGRNIKFKVIGVPRPVLLDGQFFNHILTNLISNAFKYSEGAADPEIYLNYSDLDKVEFSVKDYGIGIPKKDQKGLFSSFYRATNVKNIQGSGLGLSIVKEFIEMHYGTIDVESQKDAGATFVLTLPIK